MEMQGDISSVNDFKYLGSTIESNGQCTREVKKIIQAGWSGWRLLKGKVYKMVRLAFMYGLERVSM